MRTVKDLKDSAHALEQKSLALKNAERSFYEEVAEKYFYSKGKHYIYNDNLGNFLPVTAIVNDVVTDATLKAVELEQQIEVDKVRYVPTITILDLRSGKTYKCNMDDMVDFSYFDLSYILLSELN